MRIPLPSPTTSFLLALAVVPLFAGCTRDATEADCQLIIDRNVELQMKALNNTDPAAIAKKQEEQRKELKDELRQMCLGRKVTDSMMNCVRSAKSTDEIKQCMR